MHDRHILFFFFFNDTATTEIYTLSLHDALPICGLQGSPTDGLYVVLEGEVEVFLPERAGSGAHRPSRIRLDRKSTRLNSSHSQISYAVFCLKKKNYYT